MSYLITATSPTGALSDSRSSASGAYTFGKLWELQGHADVRILAPDGSQYGVAEIFQAISTRSLSQ